MDESMAYSAQPQAPLPTMRYCKNVRNWSTEPSTGVSKQMRRLSCRPGRSKAWQQRFGAQSPTYDSVRMISAIRVNATQQNSWIDNFTATLTDPWTGGSGTLPTFYSPSSAGHDTINQSRQAIRKVIAFDDDLPYSVTVRCEPDGSEHNGEYHVFCRLNDTSPDQSVYAVEAKITATGGIGAWSTAQYRVNGGSWTNFTTSSGAFASGMAEAFNFRITMQGNTLSADIHPAADAAPTVIEPGVSVGAPHASNGSRFGYSLMKTVVNSNKVLVNYLIFDYYPGTVAADRNKLLLLTSAGGKLYVQQNSDQVTWDQVPGNLTLASDRELITVPYGPELFILDWSEPVAEGPNGTLSGTTLDDPTVSDWTTRVTDTANYIVEVTNGTGTVVNANYEIASVASGSVTLGSSAGTGTCYYRIVRSPKVYNGQANTLENLEASASSGNVPLGCSVGCEYLGSLVIANEDAVYFSAQANDDEDVLFGRNWSYASLALGEGAATVLFDVKSATALIPAINNDYLIIGTKNKIWVQRGYPGQQGSAKEIISTRIGIVSQKAWCHTDDGSIYFLSHNGLYRIPPGVPQEAFVQKVSRKKLPLRLHIPNADLLQAKAYLEFDKRYGGIWIHIDRPTQSAGSRMETFFYEIDTDSFYLDTYPVNMVTTCIAAIDELSPTDSSVYMGTSDGYIRAWRDDFFFDETSTQIATSALLGPFDLRAKDGTAVDLRIVDLRATVASNSGTWLLNVYPGNSAEQAYDAYVAGTSAMIASAGPFSPGRSHWSPVNTSCRVFYIEAKIATSSANALKHGAIEEIEVRVQPIGAEWIDV